MSSYKEITDKLWSLSQDMTDEIMRQVKPHCKDDYVVEAVLRRELFVLACQAGNVCVKENNEKMREFVNVSP